MFGVMNSAVSVGFIGLDENYRHYANYFLHALWDSNHCETERVQVYRNFYTVNYTNIHSRTVLCVMCYACYPICLTPLLHTRVHNTIR